MNTTTPLDAYAIANVVNACNVTGSFDDLTYLWTHPDEPTSPQAIAVAEACVNVWDSLVVLLRNLGWTQLPARPTPSSPVVHGDDLVPLGSYRLDGVAGFEYATSLQLCWVPGMGMLASNKGGAINYLDLESVGAPVLSAKPGDCPVVKWNSGTSFLNVGAIGKTMTQYAGTLGGLAYDPASLLVWACVHEFYNTAGRDNLGVLCFDPTTMSEAHAKGAWRVGPPNRSWQCSDIPGLNCQRWVDPTSLEIFHANKTHEWITSIPERIRDRFGGRHLASGRERPEGAFGGADGPALYAFFADITKAAGSDLGGVPLLVYPRNSRTWSKVYKHAEGDDTGTSMRMFETHMMRIATVASWCKGDPMGIDDYLDKGPSCNSEKGWHLLGPGGTGWAKWTPMLYFYDWADLADTYAGHSPPWTPQPVSERDISNEIWLPPDPTCEGPFVTAIEHIPAVDAPGWANGKDLLVGIQPQAYDPSGGGAWKKGAALHVWAVS